MAVRVGTSRTPRCVSSMILDATSRVAGSSVNLSSNFSHTVSRASDICRTTSGSNAWSLFLLPSRGGDYGGGQLTISDPAVFLCAGQTVHKARHQNRLTMRRGG